MDRKSTEKLEKAIMDSLRDLRAVPARDRAQAIKARNLYLNKADQLKAVSSGASLRHTGWIAKFFTRKEKLRMSTLTTIILILGLIFGGGGITVASAQNSLPDSTLYPVRLFTEEVQFGLTSDPQAKWELSLALAEQRMAEIRTMLSSGTTPTEAVMTRLNTQLETTLRLAANLGGDPAIAALAQTWTRLETQERLMQQTQTNTPEGLAVQAQVQQMVQERLRLIESGQVTPLMLQQQTQQQLQEQIQLQIQLQQQQQLQQQLQDQSGSQQGNQYQQGNPQITPTRTPGACYGYGSCGGNH